MILKENIFFLKMFIVTDLVSSILSRFNPSMFHIPNFKLEEESEEFLGMIL